jgi:hypothetical protein
MLLKLEIQIQIQVQYKYGNLEDFAPILVLVLNVSKLENAERGSRLASAAPSALLVLNL